MTGGKHMTIETSYVADSLVLGASIACNGACMTITDIAKVGEHAQFGIDVSDASLTVTTLGDWQAGGLVNLERPLAMGDELGGHMVSGHVDAMAEIVGYEPRADHVKLSLSLPLELGGYVTVKGSLTVDGISLTVNEVKDHPDYVEVAMNIIPHTLEHTTLGRCKAGDKVNVEVDMFARYTARILSYSKENAA